MDDVNDGRDVVCLNAGYVGKHRAFMFSTLPH
jgi:hypothetical protein